MAVIKVVASLFSSIKTVGRALEKMAVGDEIFVSSGNYKETITFLHDVCITGNNRLDTVIEGNLIIPKSSHVQLKNLTIKPSVQIYIEGTLELENVVLNGKNTSSVFSLNGGILLATNITLNNARDIGVAAVNDSTVEIKESRFSSNGKAHIYSEGSTIRVSNSTFEDCNHAIWAKNKAKVLSGTNKFLNHSGTQIIVQNESRFHDKSSILSDGQGNGLFANKNSHIELNNTTFKAHQLPQIWLQNSQLLANNCDIQDGKESGIMLRSNAEATLNHCFMARHNIANIQLTDESRLQLANSHITESSGIGIHVREKSIVNFEQVIIEKSKLTQLLITDSSIASLKECEIKNGEQLGIYVEDHANCTIIESKIHHHPNTAITIMDCELIVMESEINHNSGNGVLSLQNAQMTIESTYFHDNDMPHIAGKEYTYLIANQCEFSGGKSIYLLEHSNVQLNHCQIKDGDGVQIEVMDQTKLTMHNCLVRDGKGNAVKASKNSMANIYDSQIMQHRLPQVVINDSSLIFKNSELIDGERNGFIIENYSEAHIQDSFISKHRYPQIWIDKHSTVELKVTQIKDGNESDIYVQNYSSLYADQCIIRNERFQFNVQAVNHSKIDLTHSVVENALGDEFYIENNSFITHKVDGEDY